MSSSMQTFDLTLKHPSRMIIFGPSSSGKTTLIQRMLTEADALFGFYFDNIKYISGQAFPSIDSVNDVPIEKYSDLNDDMIDSIDSTRNNIIVFDDNIYIMNDRLISDMFTKLSHHKNFSIVLLLQNLYPKTKFSRDISINSNYIILMSNPREVTQVQRLSHQIDGSNFILESYLDNTRNKPYSYLVLDFVQDTPDILRVRSELFGNDITIYVKIQKNK